MKLIDTGFAPYDGIVNVDRYLSKRYSIRKAFVDTGKHRKIDFIWGTYNEELIGDWLILTCIDEINEKALAREFSALSEEEKKARVARLFGG
jgi:hypothetical protein